MLIFVTVAEGGGRSCSLILVHIFSQGGDYFPSGLVDFFMVPGFKNQLLCNLNDIRLGNG